VEDHGKFVYDDYIGGLPFLDDENFISELSRIVKERQIDAIFPAMDSAIDVLKRHEEELECKVIASPSETAAICLSKQMTYEALDGKVLTPHIFEVSESLAFPVLAKPKVGYGGRGVEKIESYDELRKYIGRDDYLICEYLPGEEYTVDCFTDRHGNLLYQNARKRNRVKGGISVNTYFCRNQEEFKAIGEAINNRLTFRGAWFYQVKRNVSGELCLLEVASRIGGSSLLSLGIGVNLPLMSLFDAFDVDVKANPNSYDLTLDRALDSKYKVSLDFDTVYVDFDDCLLLEEKYLNTQLVAFLYKSIDEGKKVVLLTKHAKNIDKSLKQKRLDRLFDEVIHLEQGQHKADFIESDKSIFIDDSHAERKNVATKRGIPTFSPDMIEVLM